MIRWTATCAVSLDVRGRAVVNVVSEVCVFSSLFDGARAGEGRGGRGGHNALTPGWTIRVDLKLIQTKKASSRSQAQCPGMSSSYWRKKAIATWISIDAHVTAHTYTHALTLR